VNQLDPLSVPPIDARTRAALAAARARIGALPSARAEGPEWLREITVIVKAFERPQCVATLLESVRRFYPSLAVLVCDDGREPLYADGVEPAAGVRWFTLPFAAGHTLGAGRNHLLRQVATPLFFLADDDHVFTRHTRLDVLRAVLNRHALDLVGGSQEKGDLGAAIFEQRGDVVYQRFYEHRGVLEPGVVRCDRVSNTFLARTERVREIGWEERVYAAEHADFFLRATRAGLRIALVGYVHVDHDRTQETVRGWLGWLVGRWLPHRDRFYARLRRGGDGVDAAELERKFVLEKNGVRKIVSVESGARRRALAREISEPFYAQANAAEGRR
jgi:hypothetical protein